MDFAYFWKEWTAYLNEKYFSPDLTAIENYDTTDIQRFLPLMIVGVCIGTFLATCISYYHGHFLGSVVTCTNETLSPPKARFRLPKSAVTSFSSAAHLRATRCLPST